MPFSLVQDLRRFTSVMTTIMIHQEMNWMPRIHKDNFQVMDIESGEEYISILLKMLPFSRFFLLSNGFDEFLLLLDIYIQKYRFKFSIQEKGNLMEFECKDQMSFSLWMEQFWKKGCNVSSIFV